MDTSFVRGDQMPMLKRPGVAYMFLAGAPKTADNPDGWVFTIKHDYYGFPVPLDRTSSTYVKDANERAVTLIRRGIDYVASLGFCDTVIIKDPEGQRWRHGWGSYEGGGIRNLRPEFNVDSLVNVAQYADSKGLAFGLLLRDSDLVAGIGAQPIRVWSPDPAAIVAAKWCEVAEVTKLDDIAIDWDSNVVERSWAWPVRPGVPGGLRAARSPEILNQLRSYIGPKPLIVPEYYERGYETDPNVFPLNFDPPRVPTKRRMLSPRVNNAVERGKLRAGLEDGARIGIDGLFLEGVNTWVVPLVQSLVQGA